MLGLFKASPGSLIGKSMVLFIAFSKAFFARLTRLSDSGGLGNWEIYFRAAKSFPAHVDNGGPGTQGAPLRFRLIRDATETKKQEMIARLATFPELNPEPVSEVDAAGHVYYMNPAARFFFRGFPRRVVVIPSWRGSKRMYETQGSRKRSFSREVQVDGRWFLQTVSPVRDTCLVRYLRPGYHGTQADGGGLDRRQGRALKRGSGTGRPRPARSTQFNAFSTFRSPTWDRDLRSRG